MYWDSVGATKTFTHPVNLGWLAGVRRDARILDYGCGYGRVTAQLTDAGFTDVTGLDPSPAMIERGRALRPGLRLAVLDSPPAIPCANGSFDVVLLFAVLTCVPSDDAQRALIAELGRVLTPGGLLYVSDLVLQDDERNLMRYAARAAQPGVPYGVFETGDGALCRHHDIGHLRALLAGFEPVHEHHLDVATMNGHRSRAVQLFVRRLGDTSP